MPRRPRQLAFSYRRAGNESARGGKRAGAGRPRTGTAQLRHGRRPALTAREPVHVTVRVVRELAGLRGHHGYVDVQGALATQLHRADFRICHVSIQRDHVHLLVEADDAAALGNGMRGFLIALTRRLNARRGRRGAAFVDRYHATVLRSPRHVRAALAYVLNNWRKHGEAALPQHARARVDPYSSAGTFAPWAARAAIPFPRQGLLPVAHPQSWLLQHGWRRAGPAPTWHATPGARPADLGAGR